jgi:hypothetical protein
MSSKLSINLNDGKLEVEGSEEFIKEMYSDFKTLLSNTPGSTRLPAEMQIEHDTARIDPKPKKGPSVKTKKPTTGKPKHSSELKLLTDLNLRPKGKTSLKDFASQYQIKIAEELTLVIVYYLKQIMTVEKVSVNHVFTSYKELGKKVPSTLKQVLINHKNTKNWIDVTDWENINYTIQGMNHMDHDIEKL